MYLKKKYTEKNMVAQRLLRAQGGDITDDGSAESPSFRPYDIIIFGQPELGKSAENANLQGDKYPRITTPSPI